VIVLLLAQPALADDDAERKAAARTCFERGLAHFREGRYEEAQGQFLAGWALEKRPLFLYNAAQAARRGGRTQRAVELYREFLQHNPQGSEREDAEIQLQSLGAIVPRPEPPPPPKPEPPPPAPPPPAPTVVVATPAPRDRVGPALIGVGSVLAVAGVISLGVGAAAISDSNVDYGHFESAHDMVPVAIVGGVLFGAGVAVLAGGVVRWKQHR
jgi:tetratricopeptide (TPR) repeat protein